MLDGGYALDSLLIVSIAMQKNDDKCFRYKSQLANMANSDKSDKLDCSRNRDDFDGIPSSLSDYSVAKNISINFEYQQ